MALARGEKRLIVCCAFGFLSLAGVALFYGYINATPALPATSYGPAPRPNGYDLALQAARKLTVPNPPLEANRDLQPPAEAQARAQRYGLARKNAWLRQNAAALQSLNRAQQTDWLQPTHRFGNSPDSRPFLSLGRAVIVESNAHWLRGEHNAALQSGLDVVQLGVDFQRGGGTDDHFTGSALSGMSRATGDTVPHLNAAQAKSAARRLEKLLAARWSLRQAWEQDKLAEQQFFLSLFGPKNWRLMGLVGAKPPTWRDWLRVHTISKKQIIADIGAKYDHEIANTRLPYRSQKAPLAFPQDPFADYIRLSGRAHFYAARAQTRNRVLMLRLALRAHQLERGAPPPNLQALVPNYIRSVPADPFGAGEPLRYRTDGVTYALWSIGSDGTDDGGTPIPWQKKAPQTSANQRALLPSLLPNSRGDYVAGKNY